MTSPSAMVDRFVHPKHKTLLPDRILDHILVAHDPTLAAALAAGAELEEHPPGAVLMTQGDPDNHIYLLLSGDVAIEVHGAAIGTRQAGSHVGEMALVEPAARRSATVRAINHVVAARIEEPHFSEVAKNHPQLWRAIAVEVCKRLREREKLIRRRNAIPRLFIGSASEDLSIASLIQARLQDSGKVDVVVWNKGVFGASHFPIEDLEQQVERSDFAVMVASGIDTVTSRNRRTRSPRDNIILELGLFMGALGRRRAFLAVPKGLRLKIPNDIEGLTTLRYEGEDVADCCDDILRQVRSQGVR